MSPGGTSADQKFAAVKPGKLRLFAVKQELRRRKTVVAAGGPGDNGGQPVVDVEDRPAQRGDEFGNTAETGFVLGTPAAAVDGQGNGGVVRLLRQIEIAETTFPGRRMITKFRHFHSSFLPSCE